MSEKEYKAGRRLENLALNMKRETGASAFHSLIHAALRQAESDNLSILARMFPKIRQESKMFRDSAKYDQMDLDLVTIAKLAARYRQMLGIGIKLYEISSEIASATGGDVDDVHAVLSKHYNEIVLRNGEV